MQSLSGALRTAVDLDIVFGILSLREFLLFVRQLHCKRVEIAKILSLTLRQNRRKILDRLRRLKVELLCTLGFQTYHLRIQLSITCHQIIIVVINGLLVQDTKRSVGSCQVLFLLDHWLKEIGRHADTLSLSQGCSTGMFLLLFL